MHSFIIKRQPATFNSWKQASNQKRLNYRAAIESSFKKYYENHELLTGDLYGAVYHFYYKNEKIDADNLSKPLWDCLQGFLFENDFQVKIRITGSFDLVQNDYDLIDFSRLNKEIADELQEAFLNEEHIVYVECGELNYSMYRFNLG